MLVTNLTAQDYYFGPLHLPGGNGQSLTVDDTTATSLYLTNDGVADALNTLAAANMISVSGAALPFPRPTGTPEVLHGDGSPEGLIYAGQGSIFLRRDAAMIFSKTTGVHVNTGWQQYSTSGNAITGGTVTSLGVGSDGKQALLRLGTSPFNFIALTYDGTYGKWVSEATAPETLWSVLSNS